MAQKIQRLTALAVARTNAPGLYADGGGLYLRVGRGGAKSWAFRFMLNGKPREMGFGSFTKVSLADARKKASDAPFCSVTDMILSHAGRTNKGNESPPRN
jgi:hypothetical protein